MSGKPGLLESEADGATSDLVRPLFTSVLQADTYHDLVSVSCSMYVSAVASLFQYDGV